MLIYVFDVHVLLVKNLDKIITNIDDSISLISASVIFEKKPRRIWLNNELFIPPPSRLKTLQAARI